MFAGSVRGMLWFGTQDLNPGWIDRTRYQRRP